MTGNRHVKYAFVILGGAGLCALAGLAPPARREWLLWELGPIQIAQALILLYACVRAWRLYRGQERDSDERPAIASIFFLMVYLFWREAELDYSLIGHHAFSWRYLVDGSSPLIKIGLGLPSLALTYWLLSIVLPCLPRTLRLAWQRRNLPSPRYLLVGLVLLGVSQLWDRAANIAKHTGLTIFETGARDPLPEELLEFCGELVLLVCVLELDREVRARLAAKAKTVTSVAVVGQRT